MLINIHKPGQLGNRLIAFAKLIAYAKENNLVLINPAFDEYSVYFESTSNSLLSAFPPTKTFPATSKLRRGFFYTFNYFFKIIKSIKLKNKLINYVYLDWNESLDLDNINLSKAKYYFVSGWGIKAAHLIIQHKQVVKDFFKPVLKHRKQVDSIINKARAGSDLLVGIHIRRGDYKNFEGGKFYYEMDVYRNSMQRFQNLFPDKKINFLICSNEQIDWEYFKDFNCYPSSNHLIEDLYSFANCDYLIGPPSTYTIWASFYGDVPLYLIETPNQDFSPNQFKIYLLNDE